MLERYTKEEAEEELVRRFVWLNVWIDAAMGLVGNGNPHFFHQEAGVHILGDTWAQAVGECQFIVCNVCFKAASLRSSLQP